MEDEDRPRLRGDGAALLSGESLDSYSLSELDQRIALLQAEIERVKSHKTKAAAHMAAAASLFKSPGSSQ